MLSLLGAFLLSIVGLFAFIWSMRHGLLVENPKRYVAALSCVLALAVAPALARPTPDAIFELTGGQLIGIGGYRWATGTLHYRGASYRFVVDGLTATALDVRATASGAVFHLGSLEDFDGVYTEVDMPLGHPPGELRNGRGVVIQLSVQPHGDPIQLSMLGARFTLDREAP